MGSREAPRPILKSRELQAYNCILILLLICVKTDSCVNNDELFSVYRCIEDVL